LAYCQPPDVLITSIPLARFFTRENDMNRVLLPARCRSLSTLLLLATVTAGCSHTYLYNEQRDKLGQAATKAAGETRLVDAVNAVEKRFRGLLELEVDAAVHRFNLIREQEIREIAFSEKALAGLWVKRIEDRLERIAGKANWDEVEKAADKVTVEKRKLTVRQDFFTSSSGLDAPECVVVEKNDAIPVHIAKKVRARDLAATQSAYSQLRTECTSYLAADRAY
jgi:hypothetical protein